MTRMRHTLRRHHVSRYYAVRPAGSGMYGRRAA